MSIRPILSIVRPSCFGVVAGLLWCSLSAVAQETPKVAVLASLQSPYLALAREIADTERIRVQESLDNLRRNPPNYVLWVAAPRELSDEMLSAFLRDLRGVPSVLGLITGSTEEAARALWLRAVDLKVERCAVFLGEHPEAGVPEARMAIAGEPFHPADKTDLLKALGEVGYLHYAGHGSSGYWTLKPHGGLLAGEVPELGPLVVSTESCQTARPWESNNMALRFVDQGAAAYAGFAYSPFGGYTLGALEELPFRYTSPDFPIGRVVAVQNADAARVYARLPSQLVLGDPRIALQSKAPYTIVRDEVGSAERQLIINDAPAGILPVRIPGGARYIYVAVPGVSETPVYGGSYNSRLQAVAAGNDLYVLVRQGGGSLEMKLWERAPFLRAWKARFTNVLDHSLVYLPGTGGGVILSVVVGLVAWLLVWRRHREGWLDQRMLIGGLGAGLVIALLHLAYQYARAGEVTITSKPVDVSYLACAGAFLVASGACCRWVSANTWRGRVIAVVIAISPLLVVCAFCFTVLGVWNVTLWWSHTGAAIYTYTLARLPIYAAILEVPVCVLVFWLADRWAGIGHRF